MAHIASDEIRGYEVGGKCYCSNCDRHIDTSKLTYNQVITDDQLDDSDDLYFCDECHEQLFEVSTHFPRMFIAF
jgi:hypothetical protein